jgi:gluconate 5-dehydrogenase
MYTIENITDLTNKVAVITGGGSGIGLGIAKQFIALGAKVIITGRDPKKLEEAKKQLGTNCFFYCNDVTQKAEHGNLIKDIEEKIGPIDILVNNAGRHSKKPSLEATDKEFQDVMDINVNSIFALTRTVLEYMIPRKKGSIINISSMAAIYGIPLVVAYSCSKTALLGMTRALASEYSHTGIRFNAIAPGFIESKMFRNAMAQDPERERKILSRTPAQRFGAPSDIGKAAAFLASDASEFITGVCLPVDGGNSIGF